MNKSSWTASTVALLMGVSALAGTAWSADMVSFATGGYAQGLRGKALFDKVDANGDGMISRDEWIAFQERVFAMLDKRKTGLVDAKEFTDARAEVTSVATGGYARGLGSIAMMHKIDTDSDGTVSRDEFIAYQNKVFDMMDVSKTHQGQLGREEISLATGGPGTHHAE